MFCGNADLSLARAHFATKTAENFNESAGVAKLRLIFEDLVTPAGVDPNRYHFAAKKWEDLTFFEWVFSTLLFFKVDVQIGGQKVAVALNAQSVRKRLESSDLDQAWFQFDEQVVDLQHAAQGFFLDEKKKIFYKKEAGGWKVFTFGQEERVGSKRIIHLFDPEKPERRLILAMSPSCQGVDEAPLYKLIKHRGYYLNAAKPLVWGEVEGQRYALYDLDAQVERLKGSELRKSWPKHTRIMDAVLGVWEFHQIGYTLGQVKMVQIDGREFVFDLSRAQKGMEREKEDVLALGTYLKTLIGEEAELNLIIDPMCAEDPKQRPSMRQVVADVCTWQALQAMGELKLEGDMKQMMLRELCELAEGKAKDHDAWRRLFITARSLWILAPEDEKDGAGAA